MASYSPEVGSSYADTTLEDLQQEWMVDDILSILSPTHTTSSSQPELTDFPSLLEDDPPSGVSPWSWMYLAASLVMLYWILSYMKKYYNDRLLQQEALEKRRRFGIPDEDTRPFNIAYHAAAQQKREEVEAARREEEREAKLKAQQNTPWAQTGKDLRLPLGAGNAVRFPNHDGLIYRQAGTRSFPTSQFGVGLPPLFHQTTLPARSPSFNTFVPGVYQTPMFVHPQPSQPHGVDSTNWQNRYNPPSSQSQQAPSQPSRVRIRPVRPATTLGRRSRKQLNLVNDAEGETDYREPSRRRLNEWGRDYQIDGDEEAKWAFEGELVVPPLPLKDSNRIRKREDGSDEQDEGAAPLRSRRKILEPDNQQRSAPKIGRLQKRKIRDDEAEPVEPTETRPGTKTKKRVRVVSYHESQAGSVKDARMEEDDSSDPLCGGRWIGDEWHEDGVHYKVGPNGERLREIMVKQKERKYQMPADSKHKDKKAYVYTVITKWVTEEQYAKAKEDKVLYDEKKDGKLSPGRGNKLILADLSVTDESTPKSEPGSEWGSVRGQTPLKTGSLRTTGGHDRPPIPALFKHFGPHLQVDQARLAHIGSPGKKSLALSAAQPKALKGVSKWERQNREAQHLAALRLSRSKSKPDLTSEENTQTRPSVLALPAPTGTSSLKPSSSMPSFTIPLASTPASSAPQPAAVPQSDSAPKLSTTSTEIAAAVPLPKPVETPAIPTVLVTAPTNPPTNPFFVAPAPKPTLPASNEGQAPTMGRSGVGLAQTSSTAPPQGSSIAAAPTLVASAPATQAPLFPTAAAPSIFNLGGQPSASTAAPTTTNTVTSSTPVPLFGGPPQQQAPAAPPKPTANPFKFSFSNGAPASAASALNGTGEPALKTGDTVTKPSPLGIFPPQGPFAAPSNSAPSTTPLFNTAPTAPSTAKVESNNKPNGFGNVQTPLFAPPVPAAGAPSTLNIFGAASGSSSAPQSQPQHNGNAAADASGSKPPFGSGFNFGAKPAPNGFAPTFTAAPPASAGASAKPSITFGATTNNPASGDKPAPTSAFGFGPTNNSTGFAFSNNATATSSAAKPAENMTAKPAVPSFSFAPSAPADASKPNTPAIPGFSFGPNSAGPKPFAFGAPGFGAATNGANGATSASGSAPASAPAPGFGNSAAPAPAFTFGNGTSSRAGTPAEGTPSPAEPFFKLGRNAGSPGPSNRPRKQLPRRNP